MSAAAQRKPLGTGMMLERRTYGPALLISAGRICNSSTKGKYLGERVDQSSMRPGSNDFLSVPSRFNDQLSYRKEAGVVL